MSRKAKQPATKTKQNTSANEVQKNVGDVQFWGEPDTFELICKAWSEKEGWMKSTKAMEVVGLGCVVQVTTQQGDQIAEALTFVPGATICRLKNESDEVIERTLVAL